MIREACLATSGRVWCTTLYRFGLRPESNPSLQVMSWQWPPSVFCPVTFAPGYFQTFISRLKSYQNWANLQTRLRWLRTGQVCFESQLTFSLALTLFYSEKNKTIYTDLSAGNNTRVHSVLEYIHRVHLVVDFHQQKRRKTTPFWDRNVSSYYHHYKNSVYKNGTVWNILPKKIKKL